MQIKHFTIKRAYEICCKIFLPEDGSVHRVVLGVHGFAGDKESTMVERLAQTVCEKQTALVTFDFPAHGASPVSEEWLTVDNCKRDLCAVFEYALAQYPDAEKSIFATSFGGYITLLSVDQFDNVKLILRAPAVNMPKVLLENVLQISAEVFRKKGVVSCGFERMIQLPYTFYKDISSQDDFFFHKTIPFDLLVIQGDCDDIVPLSDVQHFVDLQSNAKLEVIYGADHRFKHEGEMDKIIALTTQFLGIEA